MPSFPFSERETDRLSSQDPVLGQAIARLGHPVFEVLPGPFEGLCHAIVGQQISNKAHATLWRRLKGLTGGVTPEAILAVPEEKLGGLGIPRTRISYLLDAASSAQAGVLDGLDLMTDEEAIRTLTALRGVGRWTAEMVLIFSLLRPNVFARADLGIRKGVALLYGEDAVTKEGLDRLEALWSPFCTTACLYLWTAAGGLHDA